MYMYTFTYIHVHTHAHIHTYNNTYIILYAYTHTYCSTKLQSIILKTKKCNSNKGIKNEAYIQQNFAIFQQHENVILL